MMTVVNVRPSDISSKHLPYNSGFQNPCKTLDLVAHPSSDFMSIIDETLILATDALCCPVCSSLLNHPITLSCGFSLCIDCMPKFDPATVENFDCPVRECAEKSHLFGLLKVDVTIHKLTQLIAAETSTSNHRLLIFIPKMSVVTHSFASQEALSHTQNAGPSPSSSSLSLEPSRESNCSSVECSSDTEMRTLWKKKMLNELECQVCYCLLSEPLTIPCGHTFCKACLLRFADHSNICAICRSPLPIARVLQTHPANCTLSYIISTIFPYEQMERQEALKKEEEEASSYTPIFVCSIGYPTIPCYLHVFEPRYRLMIRRCISPGASRRFGMCMRLAGKNYSDIGTMMEIQDVEPLNDGRYLVKTVGLFRFRVKQEDMRDGYHTAQVERYDDDDSDDDNDLKVEKEFGQVINHNESALVSRSTESMVREASQFGKQLQRSNVPWILQRIIRTNSKMPSDASSLSWWMAATIPIDDQEKLQILELTSAHDRLSLVCEWINEVQKQWWFQPLIHGSTIPQ